MPMYVYTGESRVADRLGAGQSCIGPATSCIVWYFQWTDNIIAVQGGWQPEAQFELDGDSRH